jgi:hypothetical protein
MSESIAADYRAVVDAADVARERDVGGRTRTLRRLRRTLNAIEARDYFPPSEREEARGAVERLAQVVEVVE